MKILSVPIEKIHPWESNPRGIKKEDFVRLKKQIKELGLYKPLVAFLENGRFVILGGNMRIRALKELGFKTVDLSIVTAKSKARRLAYSVSDNDRAGYYEDDRLAELILEAGDGFPVEDFKVDLVEPASIEDLLASFAPAPGEPFEPVRNEEEEDGTVIFTFGEYRARVSRDVYDSFAREYEKRKMKTGDVIFDDVIRAWLRV